MYGFVDYVTVIFCHVLYYIVWYLFTFVDGCVASQIVISFMMSVACIFSDNPLIFHHSTQKYNTHISSKPSSTGLTSQFINH